MRYWSQPHDSVSRTATYLEAMVTSSTNGDLAFVLLLPPSATTITTSTTPAGATTDEGKIIGHAGIWYADRNELVFMIDNAYWNRGYMTEVLAALVPIFWEKGLKKVYADANPDNEASLKVLRKCGFTQVGGNIVESLAVEYESLRMELANPCDGEEEGEFEFADEGSDS